MNVGIIVTPMTRGQITIPKEYREKLGIVAGSPLSVTLEDDKLIMRPLGKMIASESPYVIKPKYSKEEYLKVLEKISLFMKKNGPIWTREDDKNREIMRKKEKKWDW